MPAEGGGKPMECIRKIPNKNKMIVGLQQTINQQIGYITNVGRSHLDDNDFKQNYDELDVMCFDKNQFAQKLYDFGKKPSVEDVVYQEGMKKHQSEQNFAQALKKAENREIEEEFSKLCLNRLHKVHSVEHLAMRVGNAKEHHRIALQRTLGQSMEQDVGDILPQSIFDPGTGLISENV